MSKPAEKKVVTLAIDRCPHGMRAISVNLRGEHGSRLTSGKCCGRWDTVVEWAMSKKELLAAADEIREYAELAE
jgi:hypothetical protein